MKLLTKTSLNFLSISLFIFLIAIVAFYYILRLQVDQNINQELEKRKIYIGLQLETILKSDRQSSIQNDKIEFKLVSNNTQTYIRYSDTLIFNQTTNKYCPYRVLGFVEEIENQKYFIQLFKSLEESDNLIVRIFLSMTLLVIIIIFSLLFMNRHTTLQAWKVFYDTIEKINRFDINLNEQFLLQKSDVKEFDDLNKVLLSMTNRIRRDYLNLKEYTENASHEIQTPLAIINSKMELLLQAGDLQEKQYKAVVDAYDASNRLSRLNKTLILLAKIENRQFLESSPINPQAMIDLQLESIEDLILSKSIKIIKKYEEEVTLNMNTYLAEILFLNLVKNAIRHNHKGGKLIVELTKDRFLISNTGPVLKIDSNAMFKRFQKASSSPESLGLGLAIVQKICEVNGFTVSYFFEKEQHHIKIDFGNKAEQIDLN